MQPAVILVFSGKRKSGKDYVADIIQDRLGADVCAIMRLSGPLKEKYAKENNLDYGKLLDASGYKEKYREDMIQWGENKRNKDPGLFCRAATSGDQSKKQVWIISDARRSSDLKYFQENYSEVTQMVRVVADEDIRKGRGFVFTPGIDDAESECGLDHVASWDIVVTNNGNIAILEDRIASMIEDIESKLKPS